MCRWWEIVALMDYALRIASDATETASVQVRCHCYSIVVASLLLAGFAVVDYMHCDPFGDATPCRHFWL
jgi:hypothetical protein